MTQQEAWKILGLTGAPATEAELLEAFKRTVAAAQARMRLSAAHVDQNQVIRGLQGAQQAYGLLRQQLAGARPPRSQAPAPPPAPPRGPSPRVRSTATRPPASAARHSASRPAPAPRPIPGPPSKPRRQPLRPIPGPGPRQAPGWSPVFFALVLLALLAFVFMSGLGREDEPPVQYYLEVVPVVTATANSRGQPAAQAAGSIVPPEESAATTVEPPVPADTGDAESEAPKVLACWVKLLSYPVARIEIDGGIAVEAPGPEWYCLAPGLHVFKCQSVSTGTAGMIEASFLAGGHYEVLVDLEAFTHEIREVNAP